MRDQKPTHIIVKSRHPVLKQAVVLLLLLAVVGGGWLLFEYGRKRGGFDALEAGRQQKTLQKRIEALKDENRQLNAQISLLERASEIDNRAYDEVNSDLANLRKEMLELRQEVEFYRGILNAEDTEVSGLKVQTLKLRQDGEPQHYRFRLILSQLATTNPRVKGEAEMTVSGVLDGNQVELSHRELVDDQSRTLPFNLRHFQELSGGLTLPEGFVPLKLILKVVPGTRRGGEPLEQTYSWTELVS